MLYTITGILTYLISIGIDVDVVLTFNELQIILSIWYIKSLSSLVFFKQAEMMHRKL